MSVKFAIVEDHELFREGIISLLERNENNTVIGKFSNGKEFIDSLENVQPDIVLMDISMPVMDGIAASRHAISKFPGIKILVLTMFDDYFHYQEMLSIGVKGFILKDIDIAELELAIQALLDGKTYFSNKLLQNIIQRLYNNKTAEVKKDIFTEREITLIDLICQGLSNKSIATKMFISVKTVESNKSKLFVKANVKNSMELVAFAMKNKLAGN